MSEFCQPPLAKTFQVQRVGVVGGLCSERERRDFGPYLASHENPCTRQKEKCRKNEMGRSSGRTCVD